MTILPSSKAAAKVVGFENRAFSIGGGAKERKINIIGTYDPTLTEVVDNVPVRIFSAEDARSRFGAGFMLHRLAKWVYAGSQGIEAWVTPQPEAAGDAATKTVNFAGTSVTKAGKMYFYIAADLVEIDVAVDDDPDDVAVKMVAAIPDTDDYPVKASGAGSPVTLTAKSKGPWGIDIKLAFNLKPGETLPDGVSAVIADGVAGTGVPDVDDALNSWGTGDNQNEEWFTDVICGYGQDSTTLDKIAAYNGIANDLTGNYAKEVGRPFRALVGDTVADTAGLTAAIALADLRTETDMTNGILSEPGSYHHPMELAAIAMGVMARVNSIRAEETYIDKRLPGIIPSPKATRWTNDYDNRDLAVKNGVGTTMVKNNVVTLQNVLTFYRPSALPLDNNAFRSQRNISIVQNMWNVHKQYFAREEWIGFTVVADKTRVRNLLSQEKARDADDVLDALIFLTQLYLENAWLYTDSYTLDELKEGDKIITREDGSGWDYTLPGILSGEGGILNGLVSLDASFAVLNLAA